MIAALIGMVCVTSIPNREWAQVKILKEESEPNPSPDTTIYDYVVLFSPSEPVFEQDLMLAEGIMYRFEFETYTPFSESFVLDCSLESPTGKSYHLCRYQSEILRNVTRVYFYYGAAETGIHRFTLDSSTEANTNLHILINGTGTASQYYQRTTHKAFDEFDPDTLDFYDIHLYTQFDTTISYQFEVVRNTEYWFHFFRTNPLVGSDVSQANYENPFVSMTLSLGGSEFVYWPEGEVQTQSYGLETNIGGDETNLLNYENITLRFGAHMNGTAEIDIGLDYKNALNLNFAFLCFATRDIAANASAGGIDRGGTETSNSTNDTNSDIYDNMDQERTSSIETFFTGANQFIGSHWDVIFYNLLGTMAITFLIQTIIKKQKVKEANLTAGDAKGDDR